MAVGWIKLHRSITDHWLWDEKPFDKRSAWIDLLMLASYEDSKRPYRGNIIECKRGDVNLSISFLADRWGWDRKKVRAFLKLLESDNMATVNSSPHRTIITIENYRDFQDCSPANSPTKGTITPQQTPHNKEIERNKKSNIKSFSNFKQHEYDFEQLEKDLGIK